jgi:hypothetical protein
LGVETKKEVQMNALKKFILRAIPLTLTSLILLSSQPLCAQSSNPQFLFAVQPTPQGSTVITYSVDQTTGALAVPAGVGPAPVRIGPPSGTNQAAVVNSAGTFLFIAGTNGSDSAVSVLSISASGALSELLASPFSAADGQFPVALVISPDGQYLYELSSDNPANPPNSILDVYSIASDGTLTPIGSYTLPPSTILYMHPTGQWLYAYGDANSEFATIQQFTIGPPGVLTNAGSLALPDPSQAEGLVGDSAGQYLFSLRNQYPGGVNLVDTLALDGNGGGLTLLNTYPPDPTPPPGEILGAHEVIDSTNGFLYTSFANSSLNNGIPTFLQLNAYYNLTISAPLLLASRTSPFLFTVGQTDNDAWFLSSDVIGSGGTLTAAPGSPYTLNGGYYALAVTGSVPVPTEPILTLSTSNVSFPGIALGQTPTSTVTLSNTGFSPLTLNSISVSGDASFSQTNNCPNSLAVGSNCAVTVKFAPTAPGTFTGALNITSNAPSASVSLFGSVPSVADPDLTPSTLTFPSTIVGDSSATQSLTIENLPAATASLQITGVTIGGSNASDFSQTNNCTSVLNAGQSCTVTVTFMPLAAGGRSATVTATTDDPDVPRLGVTLNGEGAAGTQQFQLQTSVVGPGTVQQSPSGTSFNANASITLTAVPNANATFASWSGECAGSSNTVCTFSITADTTVTATFTANPAISVTQSQQTGGAGNTFTFPITVTGFTTQPTLTASCSIPGGTCTISGTNLIVTTTARSAGSAPVNFPTLPAAFTLALALCLLSVSSDARKIIRSAALIGGLAVLAACQTGGGGSGAGTPPATGTPAGTYTVTIHATAGSQTSTTTVTVVVQ